ncbi:SGNH/GDSL hydrolase family protein [Aliiroseovarius lamellibrachiae]|uniref:SGNH/GDSL hydrolase family protein n=1 Tax=Aliiroseovarius lamellibrachiae TaxID=1924933 RepID=UPI001FE719CD|nr:SGNH/GDSL hydrolase family protein [Aliiroseovarius lamellibrachiae]
MLLEMLAKLLLMPLLTAQALRARKTATELPEPIGHRSGLSGNGSTLRLLIVGDSSAAGVGAKRQSEALSGQLVGALASSHRVEWRLIAKTGATTRSACPLLRAQTPSQMDVALVVLGVNDITSQIPLERLLRLRAALYAHLRHEWGVKRVIATGIPPIEKFPLLPNPLRWVLSLQAHRYDRALYQQAQELNVDYMPFDVPLSPEMMASDGFHPGPNTYYLMGQRIAQQILHN